MTKQRRVLFLCTPTKTHNDNHTRLPQIFAEQGWQVVCEPHDALHKDAEKICVNTIPLDTFDLVWPVGFGPHATFLDRAQLLNTLAPTKLITSINALLGLHGKSAWLDLAPETLVSKEIDILCQHIQNHPGDWVIKPNAGSLGRDVALVAETDQLRAFVSNKPSQYWLLQRYLPGIQRGETRTLICAGEVLGSYLRRPTTRMGLANLSQDGEASPTTLLSENLKIVTEVLARLSQHHVGFAAIDTVDGYLVEVNIANPGGLGTLEKIHPSGVYREICQRLVDAINVRHPPQRPKLAP